MTTYTYYSLHSMYMPVIILKGVNVLPLVVLVLYMGQHCLMQRIVIIMINKCMLKNIAYVLDT